MASGFPSFASLSIFGPPGYPRPMARATLSKASPAASSLVRPDDYMDKVREIFPKAWPGKDGKSVELNFEED